MSEKETDKKVKFSSRIARRSTFFLICTSIFLFSIVGIVWKQHSLIKSFLSEGNKALYSGILLESRVLACLDQVTSSVSSKSANATFVKLLEKIISDSKSVPELSSLVSPVERILEHNSPDKIQLTEDLSLSFRNMKTISFNIYRMSWINKWMNVARIMGQLIGEIDNYSAATGGEGLVTNLDSKIVQVTKLVTLSQLPSDQKLMLFGQLNNLKSQLQNYSQTLEKTKAISTERKSALDKTLGALHSFVQTQSNGLDSFVFRSYQFFWYAFAIALLFIPFGFIYIWAFVVSYSRSLSYYVTDIHRVIKDWLKNQIEKTGQLEPVKLKTILTSMPKSFQTFELDVITQILETSLNRVSKLSTETLFITHQFHFPFLLVDAAKNAVLWNASFSALTKNKTKDEVGNIHYRSLLTLQDAAGKVLDPMDNTPKGKEDLNKCFLKVGSSLIPVFVKCITSSRDSGYLLIQMMDLREETERFDSEFDSQIKWIESSIEKLKDGKSPSVSDSVKVAHHFTIRKQVQKCIHQLETYHVDLIQKNEILKTQIEVMEKRVSKDSNLKTKTAERIEFLSTNLFDLEKKNHDLSTTLQNLVQNLANFKAESEKSKLKAKEIQVGGKTIGTSMNRVSRTLHDSITRIESMLSFADRFMATKNYIHQAMEEINVAHANACIIGSKKEINSRDLKSFIDTLNRIHNELGQMNGVFEDSLKEISVVIRALNTDIKKTLIVTQGIFSQNENIIKKTLEVDTTSNEDVKEIDRIGRSMDEISKINNSMQDLFHSFEDRIQVLSQIGSASILLHTQVSNGLNDLKGQVEISNFKG